MMVRLLLSAWPNVSDALVCLIEATNEIYCSRDGTLYGGFIRLDFLIVFIMIWIIVLLLSLMSIPKVEGVPKSFNIAIQYVRIRRWNSSSQLMIASAVEIMSVLTRCDTAQSVLMISWVFIKG